MDEAGNVRRLRANRRFELSHPAPLRVGRGAVPAHLLDLSATGALVHCVEPPATGTRVHVTVLGRLRAGRVMRRDGRHIGLAFDTPLTGEELAEALRRRAAIAAA